MFFEARSENSKIARGAAMLIINSIERLTFARFNALFVAS